ncbi:nucleic acid-binding protein, putative [Medicago truncatula]|uniref:Nucleic acid-binding protein, putative n=1 Tax=Medicago truncatula TaxID=3880 RepID=A0A072UFG7_MEDTR|nr:nucleic acid-binding protein, putative [Medicago truncatula]
MKLRNMSICQSWWLCRPLTKSLFSPQTQRFWCHSLPLSTKVKILKHKVEPLGISLDNSCLPGNYHNLFCPKCKGGQLMERSLSFHIITDGEFAIWRCFRPICGWAGQVSADDKELDNKPDEESLGLEPLGPKLVAYFKERLISEKTLSRNSVRQLSDEKNVIAFTYKQNGLIVGCKYRTMEKRFWQGKVIDKVLYGLDDISHATEIIIVEGEIDKLSLEEAGYQNCVSVPDGAPGKVSSKDPPPIEKDTAYQYLWNSKDYLDKVVRIILATDNDPPGQALAEELARRLGRERSFILSSIFHVHSVGKYAGQRKMNSASSKMQMRFSNTWELML